MSNQKPTLPKGTRDFSPEVMVKRNFILETIRSVFQRFGYMPLETPAMENLSVLTGKYGDEGDQLLFKILNSGDFLVKTTDQDVSAGYRHLTSMISEKGLRYDLTVPFARFVVMNRNDLTFPFKRYQIQPVWRADRPQKGRYREFYQCDADVVGTDSLICEAEIVMMINKVFHKLKISEFAIKVNNRKILSGISEAIDCPGRESDLCVAIDKLDKIGSEKVFEELSEKGFTAASLQKLSPLLKLSGTNEEKLSAVKAFLQNSETGMAGIAEIEQVLDYVKAFGLENHHIDFDPTLARGLSYYTGAIFEVKVLNVQIGSVSGGGRYDNLTGAFGMPGVSGVGFSFGVDRLYDVMQELNLFPEGNLESTRVMLSNFDPESEKHALGILSKLRSAGINAEIFPESAAKLKKQMNYADKKMIPYVIMIGPDEISSGELTLKEMKSGSQQKLTLDEIIQTLKNN